ncbi:MAG: VWA domain-containing protein [Methylovulum sp.]|uniref:vWA domain-containing protein n=1 Tax=Methylovulum sp. TaxID=1916980 RepID=UPI00261197F3|nr:VWA domain-containing protein [Methylovulum sp.]MDD2724801.1 VWA domain-containing protein [Methylovulum sp.]MDD5126113.1 VWA domain-containing protein [Methylovulum sp.]
MIHLEWPWLLAALPLPLAVRWLLPAHQAVKQAALRVPFLDDFAGAETVLVSQQKYSLWLAIAAWCLLVFACTRPQWLGEPIEQAVSGRDLMLAVDLSGSMEAKDFFLNKEPVDRLTAAKFVAGDFINRRVGDRIGLILFGSQAYLQTPLTFDRKTVMTLLDESVLGLAGDNTAIGDAIGLAVKRLGKQPENSRVLILMTDGANTAGEVSPLKAAELAKSKNLKIYTIGIGADEMIVRSFFGNRKVNPSVDLDEDTLVKIAESTGGKYFRARNAEELNNIYLLLDKLEPVEKEKQYYRPRSELFYWPLSLALMLAACLCALRVRL